MPILLGLASFSPISARSTANFFQIRSIATIPTGFLRAKNPADLV
ncbi:hypothetical protein [Chamaesiphon sp. GL140_3_metabinner_50]|nr:hypothetical protein [Chamaesiphon sp. GL140_3_metabinner_50]